MVSWCNLYISNYGKNLIHISFLCIERMEQMKKQIIFCMGWNFAFLAYLFIYTITTVWAISKLKATNNYPLYLFTETLLLILAGLLVGWLVYVGNQYVLHMKAAALEFVIIAIPALSLQIVMTMHFHVFLIERFANSNLYIKTFFSHSSIIQCIAGIIFGYELFMLVLKIRKHKFQQKGSSVSLS